MQFALDPAALPDGYGEAVLSIAAAKAHLRVLHDDEDDLITALRDAAVQMVEQYCSIRLNPMTGSDALVWRGEVLPRDSRCGVRLGARPVTEIVSVTYLDGANVSQSMDVATLRISDQDMILPVPGASWPGDDAGAVVITFEAGMDDQPAPLIAAAKMFLGTLYLQRETIVTGGAVAEVPMGFRHLCNPWRRVRL